MGLMAGSAHPTQKPGLEIVGVMPSPVLGPEGNQEYLLQLHS